MKNFYFTFGQIHAHSVNGKTFDKDCVVKINAKNSNNARTKMFDTFGKKWSMEYHKLPDMNFYPRGVFEI
jgi:hypothetical protein